MPSRRKPSRQTRRWRSDEEYLADQDDDSSWSHSSAWGKAAANKFVQFGAWLGDRLCHDDCVADFGGNDGFCSQMFYIHHKIKPIVVDCEPNRLDYADRVYKLPTCKTFIEKMPFLDKYVDWGFCSHTLEHARSAAKAVREMSRVIKRGCYFVMPLEDLKHARKNPAHAVAYTRVSGWKRLLKNNGWNVVRAEKVGDFEAHFYAEPT